MNNKIVIAGNWKMNFDHIETKNFICELKSLINKIKCCKIVLCVPYTNIMTAIKYVKGSKISIGAQNIHHEEKGAFTGEISANMLSKLGVKYVIIGHSERRMYFNENNNLINKKIKIALKYNINPILCIGESLEERQLNITNEVINQQLKIALNDISNENIKKIIIAYEPIWAIGTGKTATIDQINEVNLNIRNCLKKLYNSNISKVITIQYGGSMNIKNAKELLSQKEINGGLIGGASLNIKDFFDIIKSSNV